MKTFTFIILLGKAGYTGLWWRGTGVWQREREKRREETNRTSFPQTKRMFCGKGNWWSPERIQSEWWWSSWRRHGYEWLNMASMRIHLYTCISVIPLCDFFMLYLFISNLRCIQLWAINGYKAPDIDIIYIQKFLENAVWVTNSWCGEIWLRNQAAWLFWHCFITEVKSCMHLQQAWIVYVV